MLSAVGKINGVSAASPAGGVICSAPHTSQPRHPPGLSGHAVRHVSPLLMPFIIYAEILATA